MDLFTLRCGINSKRNCEDVEFAAEEYAIHDMDTALRTMRICEHEIVRLTVDLPAELHRNFEASCSLSGVKMNTEIITFVKSCIDERGAHQNHYNTSLRELHIRHC